ncbi:MAG TPA: hypothetical protein VMH87_20480 [Pseudomonadales bacterium]|nr:hypothetical protein [Pseudomonadales bacterium]
MKAMYIAAVVMLLAGCASPRQTTSLTADQAKTLALQLSNDKAFTVYGCRPFHDGEPVCFINGRWVWRDLGGVASYDVEATVVLAADGSINRVDLKALYNKGDLAQTMRVFP